MPTLPTGPLIDASTLRRCLASVRAVDCSHDLGQPEFGAAQYVQGHVPGAVHAHLDRNLSGTKTGRNGRHPLPEPAALACWLGEQGIADETPVVVYDRSGGLFAARLWWLLRWIGHDNVRVLDGGWAAWLAAGGAVATGTDKPASCRHSDGPVRSTLCVDADFVQQNLEGGDALVIDARAPERFQGSIEPLDPIAGHIPGALNRPCSENLDTDGRFKSSKLLAAEWRTLIGERNASTLIAQCGSGVTACHNLIALELAGLGQARLYPGSWSEWCSDPKRPVAV